MSAAHKPTMTPAQVRAQLSHPVIDADGHVLEFLPASLPYLREALGPTLFERYQRMRKPIEAAMSSPTAADRLETRKPQTAWWGTPFAHVRDVATSIFPRLLHERAEELGLDFLILYPTNALGTAAIADDALRQGLCRGFNEFFADVYRSYADRLTVAGMIPMNTPDEAIAELEHCKALGLKVAAIPHGVLRPIQRPDLENPSPWLWPGQRHWFDYFGHESAFDYDPVWRRFLELGYAVSAHGGIGAPPPTHYTSTSSWMYNHIGSFAAMMYPLCKALLLGGVARRFPELNFAFLECGVGWAATLLADSVGHYEKRNLASLREHFVPTLLDRDELLHLARRYGGELLAGLEGDPGKLLESVLLHGSPPENLDEFPQIESLEQLREPFVRSFFFGCEADDRSVASAYSRANALGARLQPMLSSDITHFDVPRMDQVLPEAFELLDDDLLSPEEFRDFAFGNAARLYLRGNPDFFRGTAVETAAQALVAEESPSYRASEPKL
jgi:predicted TIM-barrel fold metal-dependent hydrolase